MADIKKIKLPGIDAVFDIRDDSKVPLDVVGVPGGVAVLDDDGYIPKENLPAGQGDTTYTLSLDEKNAHTVILTSSAGDVQSVTVPDNNTWTELSKYDPGYVGTRLPDDENKFLDGKGNWSRPAYPVVSVAGKIGNVTLNKTDVGLEEVDNTSDLDKPISTATQSALDNKLDASLKGANNGLAELDENGHVPASQLPSYVDDVLEYDHMSEFPIEGETGKIYVATDTNLTYRWSGSTYVQISESLAIGTTSSTAFRGDLGQIAYEHATNKGNEFASGFYKIATNEEGHVTGATSVTKADITALDIPGKEETVSNVAYGDKKITETIDGNTTDVVTIAEIKTDLELAKGDVGLSNVDNTADLDKPISTATQEALDAKEDSILHDTAAGWLAKTTFSPALGQIIVYDTDDEHDYARIKVGDGSTLASQLPFIDAGSVDGKTVSDVIQRFASKDDFPGIGSGDSLYLDETNNKLYTWNGASGYVRVNAIPDGYKPVETKTVSEWSAGTATTLEAHDCTLFVTNGTAPTLTLEAHTLLHLEDD